MNSCLRLRIRLRTAPADVTHPFVIIVRYAPYTMGRLLERDSAVSEDFLHRSRVRHSVAPIGVGRLDRGMETNTKSVCVMCTFPLLSCGRPPAQDPGSGRRCG